MLEFWRVPDMANNIANHIWKHSIHHNAAPAVAIETLNGNILQKLGLSWLPSQAPGFYINSSQVKILNDPGSFYNLLLSQIRKAKKRIVLSSLYLGTGPLEENLVATIKKRLSENPDLRVKVLLDCTRGSRGVVNSRKIILPLLENHRNSCQVSLYQTPYLQKPFVPLLPTKYKEIAGLQHIKVYLFDDNFIITGANLSNDYFTNRQDRYILVEDSKDLCNFVEGLIDKVSEFSFRLNPDDTLSVSNSSKLDPSKTDPKTFNFAASTSISKYYSSFIEDTKENQCDCDTVIFPLLEMGPLNIHTDSHVTTKLMESCDENAHVHLTTGYFNLTDTYIKTIINRSSAAYTILMAHPQANGFYNAKFPAGGIPHAYTHIASKFLNEIRKNEQSHRITMSEYLRPNWTYHAKGLWVSTNDCELPYVTMVGSPNFGERSVKHDLECQFLLATTNEDLQYRLREERKSLYDFSHMFYEKLLDRPDRQTPAWVKLVVWLFRSYL